MAVIDFLPVCSKCHQVLWGEEIGIEERRETMYLLTLDDKEFLKCWKSFSTSFMNMTAV